MKNLLLTLFLALLTLDSYALDYELVSFTSTPAKTPEMLLKMTNKRRADLAPFNCMESTREELFTPRLNENEKQDSLRFSDSKGNIYIYKNSKLISLDGKTINKVRDRFLKSLLKTMKRLESFPESKQLINELQSSLYIFTIMYGGNRYDPSPIDGRSYLHGNEAGFISMLDDMRPMIEQFPFTNIGYGGKILWNPNIKASFVESDYQERQVDADLVLVHEMYHAYDGMRGLLDRRFVKADNLEFQPVCEYRAVRMENIMRARFGDHYRRFYSKPSDLYIDKDMLDENNEPEILPTPCVQWL